MSEYSVSDYSIFTDGVNSISEVNEKLSQVKTNTTTNKQDLSSEEVFMGPVCDSCLEGFDGLFTKLDLTNENYAKFEKYLKDIATNYKESDKESASTVNEATDASIASDGKTPILSVNDGKVSESNIVALGNHQAKDFYALGDKAYNAYLSDDPNIQEWIEKVGKIVQNTNTYGMKKSLIIAQIINESGWMSSHASSLSDYNNVLGVNTDMGKITPDMQDSTWSKKRTSGYNDVTQWSSDGSHIVGTNEEMRHYDSIEECIEDYANILYLCHPELKGNNDIWAYSDFMSHYTPNPNEPVINKYANMIEKYNLDRFDT